MMDKDICEEIADVMGKIHGERSDAEVTGVLERCHEAITALRRRAHEVELKLQHAGRIEHGEPEPAPPPMSEAEPSWERAPQFEPPLPPPEREQTPMHHAGHEHKGKHEHKAEHKHKK